MISLGDGIDVVAKQNVTIGSKSMYLSADIVEEDIPLLLSKDSIKRGKMKHFPFVFSFISLISSPLLILPYLFSLRATPSPLFLSGCRSDKVHHCW